MTSLPAEGLLPAGSGVPRVHFLQSVADPAAAAPHEEQTQAQVMRVERCTLNSQLSSAQALIAELQVSCNNGRLSGSHVAGCAHNMAVSLWLLGTAQMDAAEVKLTRSHNQMHTQLQGKMVLCSLQVRLKRQPTQQPARPLSSSLSSSLCLCSHAMVRLPQPGHL